MNKEDILFVKKIFELSKKLNKNITIANQDDAANLYAYLKGYTSWSEMLFFEKNNKEINILDINKNISKQIVNNEIQSEKIKEKKFVDINWRVNSDFVKKLEKSAQYNIDMNITEKTNVLENYKIGDYVSNIMKTNSPVFLESSNVLISGDNNLNTFKFFENELNRIVKWDKSAIICGLTNSDVKQQNLMNDLKSNKALFLGKECSIKLNPLLDLFLFDTFEDFFNTNLSEDNVFIDIWLNLIRIYKEQLNYKITPRFLKESLKIENLLQMMSGVDKNIQLQLKPLLNYINKYLEIVYLKEKQVFFININAQEKHYKQIKALEGKINGLISLYENDIFDIDNGVSIFKILETKKQVVFLDLNDDKYNKIYWETVFSLINVFIKEQHNIIEKGGLSPSRFKIPLFIWDIDKLLNKINAKNLDEQKEYLLSHYYDISPNNVSLEKEEILNILVNSIKQVLFFRQNIKTLNKCLENRIKEQTVQWDVNLFYLQFNVLRELKDDEAVLWQNNRGDKVLEGLEDYIIRKFFMLSDKVTT